MFDCGGAEGRELLKSCISGLIECSGPLSPTWDGVFRLSKSNIEKFHTQSGRAALDDGNAMT